MKPHRPSIPIYVAALKQKTIESIGELADGWIPTFWPYDKLAEGGRGLRRGSASRSGSLADHLRAVYHHAAAGNGSGRPHGSQDHRLYIGGMGDYYIELLSRYGFADDCKRIAELYANKATRHSAGDAVPTAMLEALTIAGDPAQCIAELKRRRSFGVDLPILNLPNDMPWEMVEMFIRGLAPSNS